MPFKNLSAPKRLTTMGGAVTGIAPFEGGGVVATVSSDPVQICALPMSGGSPRAKGVSLDEASGVALLNKQVAVVKSGDELWALLDIQHSPKIEQVGRDIKSLHLCPAGETALAIGWDGNGAALAFANNEVGGRQFVLRGDVRTCSLSLDTTYVVVEAPGGGQFRAHPGLTPESGASARVDLPAGAQSFDRLAGGHELSALTKRGADEVCVIRREGAAQLSAVMLPTPTQVADVAVIASSLFVLGADGRLRLYNSEALAHAGSAQPTAEVAVKGNGAPSVLMSTTKGGNKLWMGSDGGDVFRCDAVKGSLSV